MAIYPPNRYCHDHAQLFRQGAEPGGRLRARTWLGTDERGRDLLARLIYGFRVSVLFALALTVIGVLLGIATGAVQGFFGGKIDLIFQRLIEIWSSMPELYLLIIFSVDLRRPAWRCC